MIPATHSRSCKSDGTWSNGEPVCNGVICAKPDSIPNGSYTPVKDEYRYPDPVTYSCNENFTFIGTSNISCGSDGTWSPEAPKCIVTCSEPNVPNSKRFPGSVSLFTLKSEVLFQCNEGFFMKGSNLASCNIDSQWEPPLPECLRACGPIPRLPEAELKPKYVDKNLTENATVQYECRPGYNRIPGSNNSIICLSNFSWSTPGQFCTRRSCPSLSEIENGYFEAKDFLFGTRATYYCNKGYMIARRNYRECTADGTWSNEDPVCEAVICPMPVSIPYRAYMPVKNKYSYQENVTYICSKDWTLLGTSTISCGSDGNWSSEAPECIERRHNIAAIVVPIVTILVIFIIIMMIVLFLLKKKSGVYHCGSPIGDGKSQYKSSETCPQTTNEYQNFSMNSPPYSRKMSGTTNGQ
ncbi:complement component receptor 1-like protein [Bombina bombina]|uniref:complement component receptor 1-like protein n=1 Tax=Bombina bombina TaxID=8345 RepID=UPI00235AAF0B|nr:complement component receptor 1-like protein [Bombina bombina]